MTSLKDIDSLLREAYLPEFKAIVERPSPNWDDTEDVNRWRAEGLLLIGTQEARVRQRILGEEDQCS